MVRILLFSIVLVIVGVASVRLSVAHAQTVYYVDPNFAGTATGAANAPWARLDSGAWTEINDALATDDVIVYFSARDAASAQNETTTEAISIDRTDSSAHRLTLDGMSLYNSNDVTPSWIESTGDYKFQVTARYPMSTGQGTNQDYVTIRGFRIIAGDDGVGGQIIYYWGGSHVVIEHNELSHHPNAGHGAGLQYGYAHHQTSAGNGGCTDIVIRNNVIYDTYGECIYVGGAEDTGLESHATVRVENNIIYNCGVLGGEGDCIDIKDGITDVTIRGNLCFGNADGPNVNGIASSSPITAEYNIIYDTPGKGIAFGTFWGRGYTGVRIAYNLLFGNAKDGIYCGTDTVDRPIDDVVIVHNTVVGNARNGMVIGSGEKNAITNVTVVNNIFADNGTAGLGGWGNLGGCQASFNLVWGNQSDYAGPFSDCQGGHDNIEQDPLFANPSNPAGTDLTFYTNDDGYKPQATSPVCGTGENNEDRGALSCGDVTTPDGGIVLPDASYNNGSGDAGCSCKTAGHSNDIVAFWGLLLLLLVLWYRR